MRLCCDFYLPLCAVIILQPGRLSRYLGERVFQLWPHLQRGPCCAGVAWIVPFQVEQSYCGPALWQGRESSSGVSGNKYRELQAGQCLEVRYLLVLPIRCSQSHSGVAGLAHPEAAAAMAGAALGTHGCCWSGFVAEPLVRELYLIFFFGSAS